MKKESCDQAFRVREIRCEIFGDDGVTTVSQALSIPARTWENFEGGVTIPSSVLLLFLVLTRVEPQWLLTGEGERYRDRSAGSYLRFSQ